MIRRHPIIFGLILLIAASVVYGIIKAKQPKPLMVRMADVEKIETLASLVHASGEIRAHSSVDIQAEVPGVIVDLPVQEGQQVKRGQTLLRLDPFQFETDLASAQANYAGAEADVSRTVAAIAVTEADLVAMREQTKMYEADLAEARITLARDKVSLEREKKMLETGASTTDQFEIVETKAKVSAQRVDSSESRLRQLEAQIKARELAIAEQNAMKKASEQNLAAADATLRRVKDQLGKATISSPLDGVVIQLNVDIGERAVPGIQSNPLATLMTIADLSLIEAEIEVDETDVVQLALNQPVKIEVDALPDTPLKGYLSEIGSAPIRATADSQQGKDFKAVVIITDPYTSLRVGMSCEAEITVATRENVLGVPIQALSAREVPVDDNGRYLPPAKPEKDSKKKSEPAADSGDNDKEKKPRKEIQGVFVKDDADLAHFRPVKVGVMGETQVEIVEGLDDNDRVITGPLKSLRQLDEWTWVKEEKIEKPSIGTLSESETDK